MTNLLPLSTYSASGEGASTDLGVFRAARATVTVTTFSGAAAQFRLETSHDGAAWRVAGSWEPITEEGELSRTFAGLARFIRVVWTVPGSAEVQVDAEPVQLYASLSDFYAMGLRKGALDEVSETEIVAALERASRTIDSYIRARVALPLVLFVSSSLKGAAVTIAVYDLLSLVGYNPEGGNENYRLRYLDILKWLVSVRDGGPLPDGIEDSTPAVSEGAPDVFSDPPRGW